MIVQSSRNIRSRLACDVLTTQLLLSAMLSLLLVGCARYRVGVQSLYPPDVATIYVPIFESNSYRRHLRERITEAVVKAINARTPFVVVNTPDADSTLSGRLLVDGKRTLFESPTDEPRAVGLDFQIEVVWTDRNDNLLRQTIVAPRSIRVQSDVAVVPEVGHSTAVGQQAIIDDLAAQIVGLLEEPW